ncbi:MAG: hypothetical protein QG635_2312, partial [Bacteroidota bacterium]|nr:hypothetical protein [Bacteroidota bacterium]
VDLTWETAQEISSSHFDIEKAEVTQAGKTQFEPIESIAAAGNSGEPRYYGPIADYRVEYGRTYSYRLKIVDIDGKFKYSDEHIVKLIGGQGGVELTEAMPNPAVNNVKFILSLDAESNIAADLFDLSGKKLATIFNGSKPAGTNPIECDMSGYASGIYTLVIKSGDVVLRRQINVVK